MGSETAQVALRLRGCCLHSRETKSPPPAAGPRASLFFFSMFTEAFA